MKTPRRIIARYVADQLAVTKTSRKQLAREVAAYLLDTNRTSELESLLRDVRVVEAERGLVIVNVVSAHPLPEKDKVTVRNEVKKLYPGTKQVQLVEQIDPDVLGGVRLEFPDMQYDATVRSKLNRFKRLTIGE